MIKHLCVLVAVSCSVFSHAQNAEEATLLAPGIISNDGVFGFTLSPDAKTALWVASKGKRDTLIIVESKLVNGQWATPARAPFSSKGSWKDIDPVFSPDGKRVFFQSTRPVPGKPDRKGFDIWAVDRINDRCGEPYHLGNTINTDASESYASATQDGSVYFMKENEDGKSQSDIYVSRWTGGEYMVPENIGAPINTPERESNPFISRKGDYIIYFSSDSTGYGDVDLYISFKNKRGWSVPVNLGPTINTSEAEFCPFYHEKQKRLYFARQRKTDSRMIENIFWISFNPEAYRRK
jgi:dipeptidyl aminopeptidase/acylaminoacyl peptidase